jgi:hypothetical protein
LHIHITHTYCFGVYTYVHTSPHAHNVCGSYNMFGLHTNIRYGSSVVAITHPLSHTTIVSRFSLKSQMADAASVMSPVIVDDTTVESDSIASVSSTVGTDSSDDAAQLHLPTPSLRWCIGGVPIPIVRQDGTSIPNDEVCIDDDMFVQLSARRTYWLLLAVCGSKPKIRSIGPLPFFQTLKSTVNSQYGARKRTMRKTTVSGNALADDTFSICVDGLPDAPLQVSTDRRRGIIMKLSEQSLTWLLRMTYDDMTALRSAGGYDDICEVAHGTDCVEEAVDHVITGDDGHGFATDLFTEDEFTKMTNAGIKYWASKRMLVVKSLVSEKVLKLRVKGKANATGAKRQKHSRLHVEKCMKTAFEFIENGTLPHDDDDADSDSIDADE